MAINENDLNQEKAYLNIVNKELKEKISDIGVSLYQQEEKINEFKKYTWNSKAGMDKVEVNAAILENDLEVELLTMRGLYLKKLLKSESSPYFGRVDFNGDKIYIGLTYLDKNYDHLIYDWRSPISNLFYECEIGNAEYEAKEGTIKGIMTKKRQYKIEDGKLIRVFDSNLNIVDDLLQEVLGNESSDKMKNIVDTIQKEQNEIIRDVAHKNLIVEGIAGSGKTSVALHRIAFLLYKINNLKSKDILILSPNNVFSEYISNVLPELGEDNTQNTTWSDFANSFIKEYKGVESFTNFVKRYYEKENINDFSKIKLSDEFKDIIDEYIAKFTKNVEFTSGIECKYKDYDIDTLNKLLHERYSTIPLFGRIELISENIANYNDGGKYKNKYIKELLTRLNVSKDYKKIYKGLFETEEFIKKYGIIDTSYINDKIINYDDSLIFIYMKGLLEGFPYNGIMKQIVVDEAQDYTPLQYFILKTIFKNASFTILGDVNQTINPYYKYDTLKKLDKIFTSRTANLRLTKTYRSSKEIIEYTNKILNLDFVSAIRNNNDIPVVFKKEKNIKEDLIKNINNLKNKYKSIAVITKNDKEANKIYNLLKNDLDISLIKTDSNIFDRNLVVVPSYVSKGLEFDSVIIYTEKDNKYTDDEKYLYYVSCTRCQHELVIYNQEDWLTNKNRL